MATVFVNGGQPPYQDDWFIFNETTLTYDLIDDPDDNDVNGFGTNGYNNFLTAGTYQVQITDYNGCESSWIFNIFDEPIPTDWASVETIETCGTGNCDGIATLEIDFDIADDIIYIPNWINCDGDQLSTVEDDPLTVENLCPGEYTCQVLNSVTNEIHSICFTIEDGNFSIDPEVSNISCYGASDGSIDLNVTGTSNYYVEWSNGENYWNYDELNNLSAEEGSNTISVDIFNEDFQCVISEEFTITEPLELTVPTPILLEVLGGWNTSCEDACDGSIQVNIVGGTPPYDYIWNGVEVITGSFNYAEIVEGLCSGEGQLGIIDNNGCQIQHNITLSAPPQIQVDTVSVTDVSCSDVEEGIINDGAIDVLVTGGQPPYSYIWTDSDGNEIGYEEDINNLTEDTYTITVNDLNGNPECAVQLEIEVTDPFNFEINPPIWGLADGPAACIDANDGFITLDPTGGTPFQDENEEYYYIYFLNGEGPNILYVDDLLLDEEDMSSINGTIENLTVGNYELIIEDANGCQITHLFEVDSIQDSCLGFIPTVFTPNGDASNETWIIPDLIFYPDATVQVYNRWGQLVFESKNNYYLNPWDGTNTENENLPFGNYYFIIDYKENEEPIYGAVTIKR